MQVAESEMTKRVSIIKVSDTQTIEQADSLAVEEPLEIRLEFDQSAMEKNISVTMRTPGNDHELAAGFLFTEGIIHHRDELASVNHCFIACAENKENVIQVELNETIAPQLQNTDRN